MLLGEAPPGQDLQQLRWPAQHVQSPAPLESKGRVWRSGGSGARSRLRAITNHDDLKGSLGLKEIR